MKNQRNGDESVAIGGEATGLSDTNVSPAAEPQASFAESHRGFAEAHKQVQEMQKSAAQNWEPDAEPTDLTD